MDEPFPVCSSIFYVFPVFCFLVHKKAEVLGLHFGCSFLFVFGINSLNFLFYEFEIVFELLHLSVHLLYEAVSLLAGSVEEAKVVLVGGNLGAQLVEAAQEASALIVESIRALFCHVLQVVLEVVEVALGVADMQVLVYFVEHIVVLLVDGILLLKWYMTYRLVLIDE